MATACFVMSERALLDELGLNDTDSRVWACEWHKALNPTRRNGQLHVWVEGPNIPDDRPCPVAGVDIGADVPGGGANP